MNRLMLQSEESGASTAMTQHILPKDAQREGTEDSSGAGPAGLASKGSHDTQELSLNEGTNEPLRVRKEDRPVDGDAPEAAPTPPSTVPARANDPANRDRTR